MYIGLLYRQYSNITNAEAVLRLYLTIVRPPLEYAVQVWHPYQAKNIMALKNIKKFALRICSITYDTNYQDLLDLYHLQKLENRRLYLSLCTLYKIINVIIFFHLITFYLFLYLEGLFVWVYIYIYTPHNIISIICYCVSFVIRKLLFKKQMKYIL